jgi:hypothetical protein
LKEYGKLKTPASNLAPDVKFPMQKHKKYEKQGNMSHTKVNPTITGSNDSEVDEIPKNFFKRF